MGSIIVFSTIEEYDPAEDTWTRKTDMPTARHSLSTSVVNGKVYAIGGSAQTWPWVAVATVEEFAPGPTKTGWTQTNGPDGGTVNTLSYAVTGNNFFAGTSGGGVFLSTNYGTSWTAVNTGLTNTNVHALGRIRTLLFAGTDGGVFRSTDNGTSWTAVNTGLTNTNVHALAVSGTNLFAGTSGGIFLSTDLGTSWTAVNTGLTNTSVWAFAVSGSNLFAGTLGGVFLSTDNGTSWTEVNTGLANRIVYALAVSGSNLFAGTSGGGVFLSTNNGTSWTAVNTGLTNTYVHALTVIWGNLFAGTDGGAFLSTNNGTSWTAVNTGLTNSLVYALAFSVYDLFAGTSGGVWRRPLSEMITSTPATPALTLPANGGTGISTSPTLRWDVSIGAASYILQVSTSADFSILVVNQTGIAGTSYGVSLLSNTTYYWRVNATNAGRTSAWSSVWSFTTMVVGSVERISGTTPTEYALGQNFPNPFNPVTAIQFDLPETGYISLKVYNTLGVEVATVMSENLSAGRYKVIWNASGFASGVYFYRLMAGSFVDTKKMLLLR